MLQKIVHVMMISIMMTMTMMLVALVKACVVLGKFPLFQKMMRMTPSLADC